METVIGALPFVVAAVVFFSGKKERIMEERVESLGNCGPYFAGNISVSRSKGN